MVEASLVCRVNSETSKATQKNCCLEKQKQNKLAVKCTCFKICAVQFCIFPISLLFSLVKYIFNMTTNCFSFKRVYAFLVLYLLVYNIIFTAIFHLTPLIINLSEVLSYFNLNIQGCFSRNFFNQCY